MKNTSAVEVSIQAVSPALMCMPTSHDRGAFARHAGDHRNPSLARVPGIAGTMRALTPGIDLRAWGASLPRRNVCPGNSGENDQLLALPKSTVPAEDLFWAHRRRLPRTQGWGRRASLRPVPHTRAEHTMRQTGC